MKLSISIIFLLIFISCENDDSENTETNKPFLFQNGFEVTDKNVSELILPDASSWTNIQQVNPNNGMNQISISEDIVNEGNNSLRILARSSDDILSKVDIEKFGFHAPVGSIIKIEADFYINTNENLTDLFLLDLECCSCWDPSVGDNYGSENQCPGVRLMMSGGNDYLSIERGKISGTTLQQTNFAFPRNQWVSVEWEMIMSDTENGFNRLLINGTEVINENAMNMPNADLFREQFGSLGVEFELQEPVFYERVQIGITANPTPNIIELYVDNFTLSIQ